MILASFAKPDDQNVIPYDYEKVLTIRGERVRIMLEPSCWQGGRLGILVRSRHSGACLRSRRSFKHATMADFQELIERIRFVPCTMPGCKRKRIPGDLDWRSNRHGFCKQHRLEAIHAEGEKERQREKEERARDDARQKAKGSRYKAIVWIHRDDQDDYAVIEYFKTRPSKSQLKRLALKRKSRIVGDWSVERL
jgi:hypothetical protein